MKQKVLITGGTGLIGSHLIEFLKNKNFEIAVLSRNDKLNLNGVKTFYWNPENGYLDNAALENARIIIHLAGENIATSNWTLKKRKKIINSRIKSTLLLVDRIKQLDSKPHTFISASAIGYYGTFTSDQILEEDDPPGTDFLAGVVKTWESAVDLFDKMGIRTIKLRIGVVLSAKGGALPKMISSSKAGFFAPVGSGEQKIAWIHVSDLVKVIYFMIQTPGIKGVYNAVAPQCVTNTEFMRYLAYSTGKKFLNIHLPAWIMKLRFGEMANLFTKGTCVSARKLLDAGFVFDYPQLQDALNDLVPR